MGFSNLNGVRAPKQVDLVTMLRVAPMGWNWALHICQSVLVQALEDGCFSSHNRIEDQASSVLAQPSGIAAAGYVDKCAVAGENTPAVAGARDRIAANLAKKGLPVHSCDPAAAVAISTGSKYDGERGQVRIRPGRLRRLARGIGACTWLGLR
jgi:hypothetical protein